MFTTAKPILIMIAKGSPEIASLSDKIPNIISAMRYILGFSLVPYRIEYKELHVELQLYSVLQWPCLEYFVQFHISGSNVLEELVLEEVHCWFSRIAPSLKRLNNEDRLQSLAFSSIADYTMI